MKLPPWIVGMNQRERTLALLVAGAVFILINLFGWSWVLGAAGRARSELALRREARKEQTIFLQERDIWTKRAEWLQQHQPAYNGPGEASTLLEQQIKPIAAKYNVLIENPQISAGENNPNYQSVSASIETKSPWQNLVHFLYDVQQPEAFIVFENINLAVDGTDNTQMKGKFKIARWFAPTAKKG